MAPSVKLSEPRSEGFFAWKAYRRLGFSLGITNYVLGYTL